MAEIEQWVNLTVSDKWKGEGLTDRARMGEIAHIRLEFEEQKRASAWVTKLGVDNAKYSKTEKRRRLGFRVRDYKRRRIVTNSKGVANLILRVSLAGGDIFLIEVEDRDGNTLQSDEINTRRKLYYQVIRMDGVKAITAADLTGMENEFWNEKDNIYIKMVQHHPNQTIPSRRNLNADDSTVSSLVESQTRAKYNKSKNPYSFVVLAVRRIGIPKDESGVMKATFDASNTFTLKTIGVLFDVVDPAEPYFRSLSWRSNTGSVINIPQSRCKRVGRNQININTKGFPQTAGILSYTMRVLGFNAAGFSSVSDNFTAVASEHALTGAAIPSATIMATLVHEIGHKIGMVPGPRGTHALDKQSSYYDGRGHRGGHCHHGAPLLPTYRKVKGIKPDCTMFGDTRSKTASFCEECRKSLRKLDLRSRTNRGIRTQF